MICCTPTRWGINNNNKTMKRKTLGWAETGIGFSITCLLLLHFSFLFSVSQSDKSEHDGSSPLERSSPVSFIFKSVKFLSECHYWDCWSLLSLAASLWISRVLTLKQALKTTDPSSANLNKGSMGFTGKVKLCWISWCLASTRLKNECKLLWHGCMNCDIYSRGVFWVKVALVWNFFPNKMYAEKLPIDTIEAKLEQKHTERNKIGIE